MLHLLHKKPNFYYCWGSIEVFSTSHHGNVHAFQELEACALPPSRLPSTFPSSVLSSLLLMSQAAVVVKPVKSLHPNQDSAATFLPFSCPGGRVGWREFLTVLFPLSCSMKDEKVSQKGKLRIVVLIFSVLYSCKTKNLVVWCQKSFQGGAEMAFLCKI